MSLYNIRPFSEETKLSDATKDETKISDETKIMEANNYYIFVLITVNRQQLLLLYRIMKL